MSVVDYVVCDQGLLSHVANFVVKGPLHLLDHSPITTWLNINQKMSYNHTILNPFAPGDFAEKRILKLVEWFSGHCRAIKS